MFPVGTRGASAQDPRGTPAEEQSPRKRSSCRGTAPVESSPCKGAAPAEEQPRWKRSPCRGAVPVCRSIYTWWTVSPAPQVGTRRASPLPQTDSIFLFCFPLSFTYFFTQQVFLVQLTTTPLSLRAESCHFKSLEEVERQQSKRELYTGKILRL